MGWKNDIVWGESIQDPSALLEESAAEIFYIYLWCFESFSQFDNLSSFQMNCISREALPTNFGDFWCFEFQVLISRSQILEDKGQKLKKGVKGSLLPWVTTLI